MGWFPIYLPEIINGFFHNLSHGCNPRSTIKNIRKAIAYPHGLERN
ncbi:hypothetical protein [Nostoc sp. DedQUE09]|nr:hypothetical protein [Nostoc sp. DedQUE09]MDZ7955047.1 hypothetical protein [Nostoc sp. DedQUE09]